MLKEVLISLIYRGILTTRVRLHLPGPDQRLRGSICRDP